MNLQSLNELYIYKLQELYSVENQLVQALPNMAGAASNIDLKQAFEQHAQQTRGHVQRLEQIFSALGVNPAGATCTIMQDMIGMAGKITVEQGDPNVKDAALIAAAQEVEHFEMADYGSVRSWAKELGDNQSERLLQQSLNEVGDVDRLLSKIAVRESNPEAMRAA